MLRKSATPPVQQGPIVINKPAPPPQLNGFHPVATNITATNTTAVPINNNNAVHPPSPSKFNSNLPQPTSPINTSPATPTRPISEQPFPIARSPTAQQHANIMSIWPASPPIPTSIHSAPFFSSSPTSASSFPSPRHMTNAIPSLASLPSSPSYLSSSPFAMFMTTKEEEDEDDDDDELLPIPGSSC